MSNKTAANLFMLSSLKRYAGFYQQLLSCISSFKELGDRLVREAEAAQAFRQIDDLEEIGLVLSNHPVKEYRLIGQYYLGWYGHVRGMDARSTFEKVAEQSTAYKAKAIIGLAAIEARSGNYDSELGFFTEALKAAQTPSTTIDTLRAIAVIKAKEGYHRQALKDLESLYSLARYAPPHLYFDYLNSLAVELGEAGRHQEAHNIMQHVLASPYINAYPEWRETGSEIARKSYSSRSVISFSQKHLNAKNVLQLPQVEHGGSFRLASGPARVLNYAEWKKKMVKEPNGDEQDTQDLEEMSDKDIFLEIMHLTSQDEITRQQLEKILEAVQKITAKPKKS
jgi:tetratricopeptide (TPR) repeat protein